MCVRDQSCLILCDPIDCSLQAPLSTAFFRQKYWRGLSFPSPGDLPNPGTEPRSPTSQADSLLFDYQGSPNISHNKWYFKAGNKIKVIIFQKTQITDLPGLQDLYFWEVRALKCHEKFWTGLRFWNTGTDSHKAKHTLNNRFSCIQISFVGHLEDR